MLNPVCPPDVDASDVAEQFDRRQSRDSPPPPVILFVVNVAWFFCLHRLHLAKAAQAAGYEVHVATAADRPEDVLAIRAAGLHYHEIKLKRGTWSLFGDLRLIGTLFKLYRSLRPDLVHHVTIKPVLYGTLAARLARLGSVVNAMSGLGFVFVSSGRLSSLRKHSVMTAYRILFASDTVRVIFENSDDLKLLGSSGVTRPLQARLIRGAGVDPTRFRTHPKDAGIPLVILPARMLWIKGVREFCEAARIIRAAGLEARFALVGRFDPDNPASVPAQWLREQQRETGVEWLGHQDDMPSIYSQAHIVCLPSYGEGLPTVLLEGAACNCALVTTDVAGCREVVQDRVTGLLVPAHDPRKLADALSTLISDVHLRERLGAAAHNEVCSNFSVQNVQRATLRLYSEMLTPKRS
jgi:glycosyltransferase involved in cell wall biosynthesis